MKVKGIAEVFSSIQGEGLYVGEYQVFVRFAGCNLKCRYCDTRNLTSKDISKKELIKKIISLNIGGRCHSISITGGEPLVDTGNLKILLDALRELKYKVYLETNGSLPLNLKRVIKYIDYLSMDIKLPSAAGFKKPLWDSHYSFLKIANKKLGKNKRLFVKMVITNDLKIAEFKKAITIIKKVNRKIPLIIQPVTPVNKIKKRVKGEDVVKLLKTAKLSLEHVLVIPQIHKILGVK